ncbi:hypothetical protein CEXT_123361 [Caerostris extrusa]|uniref:Zinc finger HIT domain-containing protein 3 n=1 Tax=Caerostris extrusa TaxID=172846 RepID=A0AAV4W856_CAEEX|nr:hypothetical protein CEXT_123361 [Caerostris extrusa]
MNIYFCRILLQREFVVTNFVFVKSYLLIITITMAIGETCEVCNKVASKYKCPVCSVKYCSVACYKEHKASESCMKPEPVPVEQPDNEVYKVDPSDAIEPEKLEKLGYHEGVLEDLKNPHLRDLFLKLISSRNRDEDLKEAKKSPVFQEFVSNCFEALEGRNNPEKMD